MRKLTLLLCAAATFGAAPYAARLGVVGGSLLLVALGVMLAVAASEGLNALAIGSGAVGALASGVLGTVSPAVAAASLVGLAYAERSSRVRGRNARVVHVGISLGAGALAGALAGAFDAASLAVRGVAVVVAAVLVGLPLLVDADDPVAHALDSGAELITGPSKDALREGAELRRTSHDVPLDRATEKRVQSTWSALLRLAEVRGRLERTHAARAARAAAAQSSAASPADQVVDMVDQRIRDHVVALSRAYSAVDTAKAAEVGLDDAALRSVETMGDSLDDVSRAMVEVKG